MTKKRFFLIVVAIIILLSLANLPFETGSAFGAWQEQTWPSRTPTPQGGPSDPTSTSAPPPTSDPGGGGGGGGGATQVPPTPQPGETSTAPTLAPTIVLATPKGGYQPTAQPCGVPPSVQALGAVNVRLGPGLNYAPITSMVYLESRTIIGRAQYATWWLIQLPDNKSGWVANQAVSVQGYTGAVPVVDPPEINGTTPTPGPNWEPTPNPVCTPIPTETATLTATTIIEVSQPATIQPSPTEVEPTNTAEPTMTTTPVPATATVQVTPTNSAPPITEPENDDNNEDDPAASASSWILFIGIGLLVVGGASFIFRRR